jgi:DNA primase
VQAGVAAWRVEVPGAKDPDELVREEGPEALETALKAKEPLFEWVVARKLSELGASAMSRERVMEEVVPMLRTLADPVLISRVARRLGVHEETLLEAVRQAPRPQRADSDEPRPPPSWKPHVDVVHLLWLLVHRREQVGDLFTAASPELLAGHAVVRPTLARLHSGEPVASVIEDVADEGVQRTLRAVVARQELYTEEQAPAALVSILARLARPLVSATRATLKERMQRAAATGDVPTMSAHNRALKQLKLAERDLDRALADEELHRSLELLDDLTAPALSAEPEGAP